MYLPGEIFKTLKIVYVMTHQLIMNTPMLLNSQIRSSFQLCRNYKLNYFEVNLNSSFDLFRCNNLLTTVFFFTFTFKKSSQAYLLLNIAKLVRDLT